MDFTYFHGFTTFRIKIKLKGSTKEGKLAMKAHLQGYMNVLEVYSSTAVLEVCVNKHRVLNPNSV